ncbi:hypothetical protein [Brevundimonas sp.]|uniref:hypothetical protein n=1 Tax=Brevundimonas sp. TaxID=1871086 RepID=UPI0035651BCB
MAPFQAFYLYLSLLTFAVVWWRGGHPERAGVAIFVVAYSLSILVQDLTIGDLRWGEAVVDLATLGAFIWLAIRADRWWILVVCAFMFLVMVAHSVMIIVPQLDARGDVAARWVLGTAAILALLGGLLERWLAGETPVSGDKRWRRTRSS